MASMEIMREHVSQQYGGGWRDRVNRMPDCQVAAIYNKMISKLDKIKKNPSEPRMRETEVRGGVQLCLFENKRTKKIKEEYLNENRTA